MYRTTRASSWDDLCNQLRDTFLPHDYEYGLWDEIRSRTQGTNEKVVNFVVVMESLFRKLREPVSEHTKVNIIQRNFLPYIQRQLALHPVTTVSQIMSMARSIEEAHVRAQRYQPPPSSVKGLLEPELRYRRTEGSAPSTNCLAASTPCTSGPNMEENISLASLTNSPARPEALCWNCHQTGHKFRKCQREKQIFCFRCGRRDVTSNSCPHCVQKKLSGGSSIGHMADTPQQQTFMANPPRFENKILLDYIVAHAKGDQRPYLTVNIYGCNFFGLLDSGASRTIIGAPSWKKLSTVCKLLPTTGETCTVANGQSCQVLGKLPLPIQLRDRVRILDVLVVPSLPQELILGVDFWVEMQIIPDLYNGEWKFREDDPKSVTEGRSGPPEASIHPK
nr:unnamed protein product [Callosobruchus analis]